MIGQTVTSRRGGHRGQRQAAFNGTWPPRGRACTRQASERPDVIGSANGGVGSIVPTLGRSDET